MKLTINDLNEYGTRAFEAAYQDAARRAKCSREDFAAGWAACAQRYGIKPVFKPEAWQEALDIPAQPVAAAAHERGEDGGDSGA